MGEVFHQQKGTLAIKLGGCVLENVDVGYWVCNIAGFLPGHFLIRAIYPSPPFF